MKDNLNEPSWPQNLEEWRKGKDEFFATSHDSPFHHQEMEFSGLKYFAPGPKYRMNLRLHRYEHPETVTMATSTGTQQRFRKVGYFEFEIDGKEARLQAYKSAEREDDNQLFIPFRDGTSGRESYGAARYLTSRSLQMTITLSISTTPTIPTVPTAKTMSAHCHRGRTGWLSR
jgi:uncharacterized protein (DUF1684 family)